MKATATSQRVLFRIRQPASQLLFLRLLCLFVAQPISALGSRDYEVTEASIPLAIEELRSTGGTPATESLPSDAARRLYGQNRNRLVPRPRRGLAQWPPNDTGRVLRLKDTYLPRDLTRGRGTMSFQRWCPSPALKGRSARAARADAPTAQPHPGSPRSARLRKS